MSLADDLLSQALHLATLDSGVPAQANLRRAVFAAYYALFHLLVADASERLSPPAPKGLPARIARGFQHAEMQQVCRSITSGKLPRVFQELQPGGFSPALLLVAEAFIDLQNERHRADYDMAAVFDRASALDHVAQAAKALAAWQEIRTSDEANVFLAALLLSKAWSR